MAVAGAVAACSGSFFFQPHSVSFPLHVPCKTNFWFAKNPMTLVVRSGLNFGPICASSRSNHHYRSSYRDAIDEEPFLLSVMKDIALNLKSLAEQPSQLKYIEWPAIQSTVRTGILTLVLVALLIVALSSIDSCLSYILAMLLRKSHGNVKFVSSLKLQMH